MQNICFNPNVMHQTSSLHIREFLANIIALYSKMELWPENVINYKPFVLVLVHVLCSYVFCEKSPLFIRKFLVNILALKRGKNHAWFPSFRFLSISLSPALSFCHWRCSWTACPCYCFSLEQNIL